MLEDAGSIPATSTTRCSGNLQRGVRKPFVEGGSGLFTRSPTLKRTDRRPKWPAIRRWRVACSGAWTLWPDPRRSQLHGAESVNPAVNRSRTRPARDRPKWTDSRCPPGDSPGFTREHRRWLTATWLSGPVSDGQLPSADPTRHYRGMDLDDIAGEIYQLPLSEFTMARDARAAEARLAGDRIFARDIKGLKKPTVAAWALNLLAHQRPNELRQLVELGASLHQAQEKLAGDELRRLSRQRLELVRALSEEAKNLAEEAGQTVSKAVSEELHETLEAALADEEAAEMVLSGRLTTALQHAGLGTANVEASIGRVRAGREGAGQAATGARDAVRRSAQADAKEIRRLAEAKHREREKAERDLEGVEQKLARAIADLERLRDAETAARSRLREAEKKEREAVRRLQSD